MTGNPSLFSNRLLTLLLLPWHACKIGNELTDGPKEARRLPHSWLRLHVFFIFIFLRYNFISTEELTANLLPWGMLPFELDLKVLRKRSKLRLFLLGRRGKIKLASWNCSWKQTLNVTIMIRTSLWTKEAKGTRRQLGLLGQEDHRMRAWEVSNTETATPRAGSQGLR